MACCDVVHSFDSVNCRFLLKNSAGYTFKTFDLTELMIDAGNMPDSFVLRDLVSTFTISDTSIDSNVIPTTYADLDALISAIQTEIDSCYCPCVRGV